MLIWITGLSGSGKTTIANALYEKLKTKYANLILLDGDEFRQLLSEGLQYSPKDRIVVARKIHKMCKFLNSHGIHVICATMSLYKEVQKLNRKEIKNYYEIFIDCNMNELIKRDKKGLYSDALKGKRNDVVGINLPFDKPENCELIIENGSQDKLEEKVEKILKIIGETK